MNNKALYDSVLAAFSTSNGGWLYSTNSASYSSEATIATQIATIVDSKIPTILPPGPTVSHRHLIEAITKSSISSISPINFNPNSFNDLGEAIAAKFIEYVPNLQEESTGLDMTANLIDAHILRRAGGSNISTPYHAHLNDYLRAAGYTPTNDTWTVPASAIQVAVDAVASKPRGGVLLCDGWYNVDGSIRLRTRVSLEGAHIGRSGFGLNSGSDAQVIIEDVNPSYTLTTGVRKLTFYNASGSVVPNIRITALNNKVYGVYLDYVQLLNPVMGAECLLLECRGHEVQQPSLTHVSASAAGDANSSCLRTTAIGGGVTVSPLIIGGRWQNAGKIFNLNACLNLDAFGFEADGGGTMIYTADDSGNNHFRARAVESQTFTKVCDLGSYGNYIAHVQGATEDQLVDRSGRNTIDDADASPLVAYGNTARWAKHEAFNTEFNALCVRNVLILGAKDFTLDNSAHQVVPLGLDAVVVRLTGPTSEFSISGFIKAAHGIHGMQRVRVENWSLYDCTVEHESIYCADNKGRVHSDTERDLVVPGRYSATAVPSAIEMVYDPSTLRWFVIRRDFQIWQPSIIGAVLGMWDVDSISRNTAATANALTSWASSIGSLAFAKDGANNSPDYLHEGWSDGSPCLQFTAASTQHLICSALGAALSGPQPHTVAILARVTAATGGVLWSLGGATGFELGYVGNGVSTWNIQARDDATHLPTVVNNTSLIVGRDQAFVIACGAASSDVIVNAERQAGNVFAAPYTPPATYDRAVLGDGWISGSYVAPVSALVKRVVVVSGYASLTDQFRLTTWVRSPQ